MAAWSSFFGNNQSKPPTKPMVLIENKPKNSCAHVMPTEIFSRGHDFYKNDDKLDYSDGDI